MYPSYGFNPFHSLFFLTFIGFASLLVLVPYWFIFKKAGFSPFLALLMFVPVVNVFML